MICSWISRTSAALLLAAGLALLFGADDVLPRLVPGFPRAAAWLGQLLGGAWIGVATINWHTRSALTGGIYGRPVVTLNTMLYLVSAMVLLTPARKPDAPAALAALAVPFMLLALAYGWLMFRGPFERDLKQHAASLAPRQ
jgi:hypothetical protein